MKRLLFILFFLPGALWAQLEIIPAKETPLVFGGKTQVIEFIFKNPTDKAITADLRLQLFQASSATLLPIADAKPWKQLQVLPRQTVIENLPVEIPTVRAITEFRVRFSEDEKPIADLKVRVAPEDLLKQLFALTEKTPTGILDPDNQLKPLLKKCKVEFHDLEKDSGFDGFQGKLAIIGPFRSKDSVPENLKKRVSAKREKSLAIVWIQPPEMKADTLLPIYFVRENENAIVIVRNEVVANLAESPQSQLNLIRATQLALHPESLQLPENETP
ncbi:MAG: hypothetical protein ABI042_09240 [Verrucomicrobiota bacterium]